MQRAVTNATVAHMAGRYGMSFAKKLIEEGKYEEAVAEATRQIDAGTDNPETLAERATAYDFMEKYAEAAMDFERALELDKTQTILETDDIDDSYFSAVVGAAELLASTSVAEGTLFLERYARALPEGRHLKEAEDWKKRLRGVLVATLDRTTM